MPSFAAPEWLLLIPILFYLLWRFQQKSFAPATANRRKFWFIMRAVILMMIVAALAGFQFRTEIRQKQILFTVDLSDSIPPEQREHAIEFINRAMDRIHSPDQCGIIAFGSNPEVERFPGIPFPISGFESRIDGSATNLAEAMHLSEAVFAGNYQKNLVILSDGLENTGRADEEIRQLREKGVSVQGVFLKSTETVEASLESIRTPDEIRLKQPFHLDIVTSSNHDMPALLQIYRNGTLLQEGTIRLDSRKKQFIRIPQTISEPGNYRYEVRLNPQQDFRGGNNSREQWISVEGPPRLLLLDEHPDELSQLAEALKHHGFEVDLKASQYVPLSLPQMMLYQAIVIRNIPAAKIHDQMPLLKQYVHDFGGGFAMLGGKKSFGPGGYFQTPVENVLPVQMDLVNKKYLADVAIVIVIDKSGSMSYTDRGRQKIDLADEGGARLAEMLKKTDRLGVLAVDSVPKWVYSLQKLTNVNEAIDSITSIRAGGGGIYVYSGLREAYEKLRSVKASVKHVILFADTADCEEKDGPTGESSLAIAQQALKEDQISTTTIGIGQSGDPDVSFLEQVANIGAGRFYFTSDMFTLPEIFTQESSIIQRYYITEETFTPRIVQAQPLLNGIEAVPDLMGYVATSPKSAANIGLISHHDDPVLAFWRYGLGQSVAFTSDPTTEWGRLWLTWPDFERFWAQTARYLARGNLPPNFRMSFAAANQNTKVVVEGFDEQGNLMEQAEYAGVLIDRSGKSHSLHFTETAAGRYEATVSATGNLFGKIYRLANDQIAEESIVQYSGATPREFQIDPHGRDHLLHLTGRLIETPEQLRFTSKSAIDVHPLQDRLLLWAAFLFLIDVSARKIELRRLRLFERKRPPETAPATSVQKLKQRKVLIEQTREAPAPEIFDFVKQFPEPPKQTEAEVMETTTSEYMKRLKEAKRRRS